MIFRKKALLAVLLLAILTVLAGCHGAKGSAQFVVPETFDEGRNYELTFWAKNDTNVYQTRIYQKAIDDFTALYPNVHVTVRFYTDYVKLYNDVITNISTNTTPNVCITYPDHIATYLTGRNVVAPLDELFVNELYGFGGSEVKYDGPTMEEVIPEFLAEGVIGEHSYAIPFMRSTEACYINKTYVEALGYEVPDVLTWDYIWEVSEAATAQNADGTFKVNGQKVMIPFIYKSTDNMMISMLKQQNAGYSTADAEIEIFNDTTDELLKEIYEHAKSGAFSTFKISGYPANFLNAGQCIFAIDSTAGSTWMGSEAPLSDISADKIVKFETVVRMIPQFDTENPKMISQGPSICIFNKADPQEVLASWLFAQYLLTDDVQVSYASTEGYIPVTGKAHESESYQYYLAHRGSGTAIGYPVKIDATQLLLDHIGDTFTTPVFNGSASLRDASGQLIENVCKSARRKQAVDAAYMTKLRSDITSLYHLDRIERTGEGSVTGGDLGPLPGTAKLLLWGLAAAWCAIIAVYGVRYFRKKK